MKLARQLFSRFSGKDLGRIDAFYRGTVSQLSAEARRQYCVNLIGRLRDDLSKCRCPEQMQHIRQYIAAADAEIDKLASS